MRAAERLALSQPAVSTPLRLRDLLDDPLLVRVGRSMQPTPRALELEAPDPHSPAADRGKPQRGRAFRSGQQSPALSHCPDRLRRTAVHAAPVAGTGRRLRVQIVTQHLSPSLPVEALVLVNWIWRWDAFKEVPAYPVRRHG